MKQTAVEWLEKEIENISIQVFDGFLTFIEFMEEREKLCRQAKEIEKQQITMAFYDGNYLNLNSTAYYNSRYTTNQVIASKTITGVITKGKKYEVLQETKNTFIIKDDTNDKLEFNKSYFENEKVL